PLPHPVLLLRVQRYAKGCCRLLRAKLPYSSQVSGNAGDGGKSPGSQSTIGWKICKKAPSGKGCQTRQTRMNTGDSSAGVHENIQIFCDFFSPFIPPYFLSS